MKFLADMGISPKTVSSLSDLGYDAVHLRDEGLDTSYTNYCFRKIFSIVLPFASSSISLSK